ncbi:hypothetical protein DAPPUDRAFT_323447 [Daphnia pulex]|uniref:DOMON domain-containing protein n=1 Tax=Daphnia pulex TaxID=6669 RepID=E9GYV9_DAPPU|nr:hypothetical protein DAPPUDRAFT_323447 [Daphnia pulex]|eukprot:EFX75224.1 hypothetical protein DAPPUDRAFT_323447 [Daphnia pulex]
MKLTEPEPEPEPSLVLSREPETSPEPTPELSPIEIVNESKAKPMEPKPITEVTVPELEMTAPEPNLNHLLSQSQPQSPNQPRDRTQIDVAVGQFYGGRQDLAATLGFERDGQTIILFRHKLNSSDEADHIIGSEPMQVIWVRGQEHGKYVHRPEWKYPVSCDPFEMDCNYYAKWEYLELSDHICFTIMANHTNRWVAIGLSETTSKPQTDVVLGWVNANGRAFVDDMWDVLWDSTLILSDSYGI